MCECPCSFALDNCVIFAILICVCVVVPYPGFYYLSLMGNSVLSMCSFSTCISFFVNVLFKYFVNFEIRLFGFLIFYF